MIYNKINETILLIKEVRMKKTKAIAVLFLIVALLLPIHSFADIGPKPSVVIDFQGLEGETYFATLLSQKKSTGPHSVLREDNRNYSKYEKDSPDYDIFTKFVEYEDTDGFYFVQFMQNCSKTQQLAWNYYPPSTFKILLYFPDLDRFVLSSDIYEKYAFDSYFTAYLSDQKELHSPSTQAFLAAHKSYDYTNELVSLFVRIIFTIGIEVTIAFLFGFRSKRLLRFILAVNFFTQISLNVALNIINYKLGYFAFIFFYILLEIAVFLVEAVLYTHQLPKLNENPTPKWKPALYALVANALSFALGMFLATVIPGIF